MPDNQIDTKQLAEAVKAWVTSEAGQKAINENLKLIDKTISDLAKARYVDKESLHEPFTL